MIEIHVNATPFDAVVYIASRIEQALIDACNTIWKKTFIHCADTSLKNYMLEENY